MADKNDLTVFQKLTRTFGFMGQSGEYPPSFNFSKDELLRTDSKEDYEKALVQAQQTAFIADRWKKIDQSLYNQSVYYEPNRLSAYYDFESMEFSLHPDTLIATLTGFEKIKDLADRGRDYEFITYAYDHNKKQIVPALARNAHYTRDEMTYKITFDDDKFIIATYGHRFLKKDGVYCKTEDLKVGDSMMPFYRKSFYKEKKYNWVYSCNTKLGWHGWIPEHTMVAEHLIRPLETNEVVHHKDFNGKNNVVENLEIMDSSEHQSFHARHNNKKLWSNPEYVAKMKIVAKTPKNYSWNGLRSGKNNPAYFHIPFDLIIETAKKEKTLKGTSKSLNIAHTKLQREIMWAGYKDWSIFCEAYGIEKSKYSTAKVKGDKYALNHKIISIEPYGIVPVYDLTVPGYKNFATDSIISHNTPEVSAALDIYAEESTTMSEKGEILTIHSESKRIKAILTDLFKNVLDVDTNLQMWCRGMCKYGDDFVYLKIDPQKGIVGCQQLPNIEIERIEGATSNTMNAMNVSLEKPTRELRFSWKNKDMEFQSWEIAHFRILGDDRKLPYGTSMLDKIRRIWKQLLLSEDAMMIYRISRAPERRVFKVFVGNMEDKDIEPYVQRVANKFKRSQVVDQRNGQVDMRYNQMAVDQDYFIPVRDITQQTPIETLPGAQNLGEIADIEYIQKKLMAALRIPKAFLGFEEVVGNGKELAMMDIRFARTINRIQKSLIHELNKIALVHLYILGLEDELNNFTLALTNPSANSDLLRIESWKEKILLYKDATSDQSQIGILPVSHTFAKKNILGMSNNEVILDLQQQRLERAIGYELTQTQTIIKRTGVFDEVDKKYGISEEERASLAKNPPPAGGEEMGGLPPMGGGGGGLPPMGGGGEPGTPEAPGAVGAAPAGGAAEAPLSESRKDKLLAELGDTLQLNDIFDFDKAKRNIYEIENKLNDILND